MRDIIYKVGRRPYVVSRFVETGECTEVSSPFLISSDGKGYEHGGYGLFRQTLRLPVAKAKIVVDEHGIITTAYIPRDMVSRFQTTSRTEPMFDEDCPLRIAQYFDCRVNIGDISSYIIGGEFIAENNHEGLAVKGTVQYGLPIRWAREAENITVTNDSINLAPLPTDLSIPSRKLDFQIDVYLGDKKSVWRSLFVGYDQEYFLWENEDRHTGTVGSTLDEAMVAGKSGCFRQFSVHERDFKVLFRKQKR